MSAPAMQRANELAQATTAWMLIFELHSTCRAAGKQACWEDVVQPATHHRCCRMETFVSEVSAGAAGQDFASVSTGP